MIKKKFPAAVLLLIFLLASARADTTYQPLPAVLSFTQHTVLNTLASGTCDRRTYPDSKCAAVNAEIDELVNKMAERARPLVPAKGSGDAPYLDTGASVTVTGTKLASFLTLCHILNQRQQTYVDFDARTFDMETGARVLLGDLLLPGAEKTLTDEARSQLTAYFPELTPGSAALDALVEDVWQTPFTIGPVYLTLHYRADALYPKKNTLMHVRVPYTALTEWMTDLMRAQTDNSAYRTLALTFDDGPGRGVTQQILLALRENGATGTFFNLGKLILDSADCVCWEHDAGHAVESHTYNHSYDNVTAESIIRFRDRFAKAQESIIGVAPRYMRAPGGNDKRYVRYGVGMPIIRWNCLSGDAGETVSTASCLSTFRHTLKDHTIALMHNIRWSSVDVARAILQDAKEKGYLLVTVDELFALKGIQMQNDTVYFGNE